MTKLQKSENVANNVAQHLTEQYHNDELTVDKLYYIKDIYDCVYIDYFLGRCWVNTSKADIEEVLAEVPGYEIFQELKNANDSMFDTIKMLNKDNSKLEKENANLKERNKSLNERDRRLCRIGNEMREKIFELKELLKEVQSKIRYSSPRGIETFADLDDTLLGKINQVLGEE